MQPPTPFMLPNLAAAPYNMSQSPHEIPIAHDAAVIAAQIEQATLNPNHHDTSADANADAQELLDAIGMSYGGAPAQAPSIATSSSTVSASQALQSSSCSVHELHVRLSENNMPPPDDVRVYSKDLLKLAGLASQPAPYVSPACSEPSSSFDDKVAVSSLVKRVAQLEAALADRESTLKEQSSVLQNAFVTIVSNRRLLLQLQQDHQMSFKELHQKHALVLSEAEAVASQCRAEAAAATSRVLEATTEAQAAAREARMFEVAMNLAKTEAKSMERDLEQSRREAEMLKNMLNEKDVKLHALRVEVAGLKASFKRISDAPAEVAELKEGQKQLQGVSTSQPNQPRILLEDSEHWLQGTTIALASMPSPSPRKLEILNATHPAQQQKPATRSFGTLVDANVKLKCVPSQHPQKYLQQNEQEQQYQIGDRPLQRQHLSRIDHVVSWSSGGYSDAAQKKNRQQHSKSRGKLVFLR